MALTVPATRTFKDVIGLTGGVNSYVDPQFVGDQEVRWAENAVNKGGIWQTRPGYDTVLDLSLTNSTGAIYQWISNYSQSSDTLLITTGTVTVNISNLRDFNYGENVTITSLYSPTSYMSGSVVSQVDNVLTVRIPPIVAVVKTER